MRLSKCLRQIIQIELNRVKNPNYTSRRQNSWLFTRMTEDWTRDSREQIQLANSGPPNCSPRSNHSAMLPPERWREKKEHLFTINTGKRLKITYSKKKKRRKTTLMLYNILTLGLRVELSSLRSSFLARFEKTSTGLGIFCLIVINFIRFTSTICWMNAFP